MDAVDDATLKAAFSRLEKRSFSMTCGACGHSCPVPDDPEKSFYVCDECGASTRFGSEQPRVTVAPHVDRRFVSVRFVCGRKPRLHDITVNMERDYATAAALEILSVTAPGKHRALLAMLSAARDVPGAPASEGEEAVATLDEPLPVVSPARRESTPAVPAAASRCQCGEPSTRANGACEACFLAVFFPGQ